MISELAIIHPSAKIHESVEIGHFSIIGENVEIDEGTRVGPHVVINGPTKIGRHNKIYQYASVGENSQDKKDQGHNNQLVIGDYNVIREFATLHRGTEQFGGLTQIGNHNLFMAYTHVAHDCRVGDHNVFSNNATLGGHVVLHDYVTMAGFSAVHQFCEVGSYSFIAKASMVTKDVLPFLMVDGNPPKTHGLNLVGLKRRDFSDDLIKNLKTAYRTIFRQGLTVTKAIEALTSMKAEVPEVAMMLEGIESSTRGIVR